MKDLSTSVTAVRRVLAVVATVSAATIAGHALAQQQPAPKAQPKAAAPKATQPKGAPAQSEGQQHQQPQISFTPWTKVCQKGPEANAKRICFTGKDGRVESGQPVVAAILIEPDDEPRKLLRITVPLGMALQPGTRLVIDQGQPLTAPYLVCLQNGCMADYEASQELIGKLKAGTGLALQAVNGGGQPISIVLPLSDFAKAYDGPPIDPEELKKRLQQN